MVTIENLYQLYLKNPNCSIDTRSIRQGDLFFALKGPNFDANKLALHAIESGALYAIVDDESLPNDPRIIKVNNVLQTLQQLASLHRSKMKAVVIGITGSNGKTTTKELTAKVLSKKYNTLFTQGNLNNHIGVPLTLLKIKPETEIAVIEMGANHIGEIRQLCMLTHPQYGIITNIGKAHLEGFGSYTGVINAKSELYSYIDDHEGMVFVNSDNELLNRLSVNIRRFTFGSELTNDLFGELVAVDPNLHLAWEYKDMQSVTGTKMIGAYNSENILAAIAFGCYFSVEEHDINDAISSYEPSNSRSQLIMTAKNRIVMDAYNANPVSMEAAIRNFHQMRGTKALLILGDMLELGEESDHEHAMILKLITDLDFEEVIMVGPLFERIYGGDDWLSFKDSEVLGQYLKKNPVRKYDILIKGSRGMQMEKALPFL
ncbi:MAG: UDP-N-acetylmuramoyl-tripeptide--D-alanyl-D-alanine ligase [Bacteroidetes bacterium HGW-Bacteroidetes-1]|jgi:UDP-N-acetylmuramoyl-tripeptide--D-alanyl-D-alanine ligase|nr:MAG: UDP-N-acetylmuramoyl-tripeptide--D-alanyl-D-alanine ligase [Bacteroidetes bacterium HGW-Bacteroidetes-1]